MTRKIVRTKAKKHAICSAFMRFATETRLAAPVTVTKAAGTCGFSQQGARGSPGTVCNPCCVKCSDQLGAVYAEKLAVLIIIPLGRRQHPGMGRPSSSNGFLLRGLQVRILLGSPMISRS
jgi:hypothetical protein